MKSLLLSALLAVLLFAGCSTNQAPQTATNSNDKSATDANKTQPSGPPISANIPISHPKDEQPQTPVAATDGKTANGLYQAMKGKGWQLTEPQPAGRVFSCEEALAFRNPEKISFLILRFADAAKAQQAFGHIDETYRGRHGRAFIGKNFIVTSWGVQVGINHPTIVELSEEDYKKIQTLLNEFTA